MNIRVIVTHANGSIKIYDLNDEQLKLLAEQGVEFKLLDMETGLAPQKIHLTRAGHNLQVRFSEDENDADIVIEDHYLYANDSLLVGEASNGDAYLYEVIEHDADMSEVTDVGTAYQLPDIHSAQPYQSGSTLSNGFASNLNDMNVTAESAGFTHWSGFTSLFALGGAVMAAMGGGSSSGNGVSASNIVSGNLAAGPLVDTQQFCSIISSCISLKHHD